MRVDDQDTTRTLKKVLPPPSPDDMETWRSAVRPEQKISRNISRVIGGSRGGGYKPNKNDIDWALKRAQFYQMNSGWFTPEASRDIAKTNVRWAGYPVPQFTAQADKRINAINYEPQYMDTLQSDPVLLNEIARHENNHLLMPYVYPKGSNFMEDFLSNPPVDKPVTLNGGWEYKLFNGREAPVNFPGVTYPLDRETGVGWGGTEELYAEMARSPYLFPNMRKYYPQYTDYAFSEAAKNSAYSQQISDRKKSFGPPPAPPMRHK